MSKGAVMARQLFAACLAFLALCLAARAAEPIPSDADAIAHNFRFASGEMLPELRLHYLTLGEPKRDSHGKINNAVLLLHGTGGSGRSLLNEHFAGVLFGHGQLLDSAKYYLILPDGIGHGRSSKPSDGLHARFPQYTYADMVAAQHTLLQTLQVEHLRLIIGTSMGCMHTFMWGKPIRISRTLCCRSPACRWPLPAATACGATSPWKRFAPIHSGCKANTRANRWRRCATQPGCC